MQWEDLHQFVMLIVYSDLMDLSVLVSSSEYKANGKFIEMHSFSFL